MAKIFVRNLFQKLTDEEIEDISAHVFTRAERMGGRKEEVPDDMEEWDRIIYDIRDTMAGFSRVRNSEIIEIDLENEDCIRRYTDGDPEPYDIFETDWKKVANMEIPTINQADYDAFCKSMAILILALTEEGYTYETALKNQKEFWEWVDMLDKKLVSRDKKKLDHWPPLKPGRKKRSLI